MFAISSLITADKQHGVVSQPTNDLSILCIIRFILLVIVYKAHYHVNVINKGDLHAFLHMVAHKTKFKLESYCCTVSPVDCNVTV